MDLHALGCYKERRFPKKYFLWPYGGSEFSKTIFKGLADDLDLLKVFLRSIVEPYFFKNIL